MTVIEIVRMCETCRHWNVSEGTKKYTPPKDWRGACERTRHNGDYPEDRTSKANAFSSEEGDSVLFTHHDFGCIQHEDKERQ